VKVEGRGGNDQKATTPRSKHSATEQRRRSKINDRQVVISHHFRFFHVNILCKVKVFHFSLDLVFLVS